MQWLLSTAINGVKSNQRKKWDGRKEISSKERPETLKKKGDEIPNFYNL